MMIARLPPYSCISNYMMNDLHWLVILAHATDKDLFLAAKSQQGLAPKYLGELKSKPLSAPSTCQLRPVGHCDLLVAWSRTALSKSRTLALVSPELWNDSPLALQSMMK